MGRITEIHEKLAANDRLFESLTSYTNWETVSETLWIKDNRRYGVAKTSSDIFWMADNFPEMPAITIDDDSIVVEWTNNFGELTSSRFYGIVPNAV